MMKYSKVLGALLLSILLASCGGRNDAAVQDSLDVSTSDEVAAAPVNDEPIIPAEKAEEALDKADVVVDDISEEREVAEIPPVNVPEPTSEKHKSKWMRESPFFERGACGGWDGDRATVTAECCKYVVANYGGILDNPGTFNVMDLMSKDPYVNACKEYNDDFRSAIDKIENP